MGKKCGRYPLALNSEGRTQAILLDGLSYGPCDLIKGHSTLNCGGPVINPDNIPGYVNRWIRPTSRTADEPPVVPGSMEPQAVPPEPSCKCAPGYECLDHRPAQQHVMAVESGPSIEALDLPPEGSIRAMHQKAANRWTRIKLGYRKGRGNPR